jgi:CHAD domain-containing protein
MVIEAVSLESGSSPGKVHAARQQMKAARAGLRLLRCAIGKRAYRIANVAVRDAARPLSPVRDAKVLLDTLASVWRTHAPLRRACLPLRTELIALQRQAERELTRQALSNCRAVLAQVRARLRDRPLRMPDIRSARLGMRRVYRSGRKAMDHAGGGADDKLHEWRKQAKYLSNQVQIAHSLFNAKLKKIRRRARKLALLLGEDHDLAQLSDKLGVLAADDACRQALAQRIALLRRKRQRRARKLGKRLYRRSAKHFAAKLSRKIAQKT